MVEKLVYFQWPVSSYFGWGMYGLNFMKHTAGRTDAVAISSHGAQDSEMQLSPLERHVMRHSIDASNHLAARLGEMTVGRASVSSTVLHALGNNFGLGGVAESGAVLAGTANVGVIFSETTRFSPEGLSRAAHYRLIVAGSTWNRDILVEQGVRHVCTVTQGVDTTNFHPAPRSGLLDKRFVVFSGGKLEYRKGQDLVVLAFRAFAQRHPDALLVTAWSSPWPEYAMTVNRNTDIVPLERVDGRIDVRAWTRANGIPDDQVLHLGPVANPDMPHILRDADVAVFPNRAEGGTNLVAMEAMACGVPCMVSMNTGHRDIVGNGLHCLALGTQAPIDGDDCEGWGESDVDEIVDVLEALYDQREASAQIGMKGSAFISQLTWAKQIDELMDHVMAM